jgi:phage host-nuclease inhibitor protein Gam
MAGVSDMTASQRIAGIEKEKRDLEVNYERQIRELRNEIAQLQQENQNHAAANREIASNIISNGKSQIGELQKKFEVMEGEKQKNMYE